MATASQLESISNPKHRKSESVASVVTADTLAVGIAIFAALGVLQRLVGFGRSLVFCHLMTDDELGRWSLSFSFLMMAAPLAVLGLPGSFGRYYEHYRQRGQVHSFLRKTLSLTAVLTITFVIAIYAFPQAISLALMGSVEHASLVRNLAVTLALIVALNVTTELATAMRQVRLVSIIQFVQSALFAIVACGLLATTTLAAQGVIFGYGAGAAVALGIAVWMLLRRIKNVENDTQPLDRSLWSRLLPFAAWLWAADALFNLFDTVDRLMIVHFAQGPMSSDALVGQYHSSRVVPTLLIAVCGMLAGVILPYLSDDWERGERKKASATTLLTIKCCTLVFVLGGAVMLLMSPLLFGTLLQGRYDAGLQILPGTLLYCTWFGLNMLAQNHLLCAEKAKWTSVGLLIGLLINVLLNALLLPWLGLIGAVTATATANAVALVATLLFAKSWGLAVDRQTWLIISLPLVLLLGWQLTLAALLMLAASAVRFRILFNEDECDKITLGWIRCRQWLSRFQPVA